MGTRVRVRPVRGLHRMRTLVEATHHITSLGEMAQPTYGTHRVKNPGLEDGVWITDGRTGLRYRNPVIERTATSRRVEELPWRSSLGKVAMPRGPRSEKRPADVIGAGRSAGVVGTARRKGGSG